MIHSADDSRRSRLGPVLCLMLAVALSACRPGGGKQEEKDTSIRTAEVQTGDFIVSVTATGKVFPVREVDVLSKAGGEIIDLPVETGDRVTRGQLLVRLDPDDERRNVRKAEAELTSAQARLEKTRSELEIRKSTYAKSLGDSEAAIPAAEARLVEAESKDSRQQELFKRNLIPKEDLEATRTALEQARSELVRARSAFEDAKAQINLIKSQEQDVILAEVSVDNAEIALEEAKERLAETEIVATMEGVITTRAVEQGMVISSAISNVGGGTLLMRVADLSVLHLVTSVDETDIGYIELGQPAEITTDSYPDEVFHGEVAHISPVGLELNSVVTFDVKVAVTGEGVRRLKPGMTAHVEIIQASSTDTMWVQTDAVEHDGEGAFVRIHREGAEPVIARVELGHTDGLRREIVSGLKGDETVRLPDADTMSAWERGEDGRRPAKEMGPFGRDDDDDRKSDKGEGKKPAERKSKEPPAEERRIDVDL